MVKNTGNKRFFTWDIQYACNFHCEYCFFNDEWKEKTEQNRYPGIKEWIRVWNEIYDKYGSCYIHITGGEPMTYPQINDLAGELIIKHEIGFDTNLTVDVDAFLSKIKYPEKVSFSAAFHPDHADFEEFLNKILKLSKAGCKIKGINYVAYPPNMKKMYAYKKKTEEQGFTFTILPFRGKYKGKEYPQSYTKSERETVWGAIDDKQQETIEKNPEVDDNKENNKENAFEPTREMLKWYSNSNSREGMLCKMGEVYAKIHPDGTAHRCCMTWENWGKLGNLLEGTFKFNTEPKPCPWAKCSCSSAMIIGAEKSWERHWKNRTE